jgi:hypothetical protein
MIITKNLSPLKKKREHTDQTPLKEENNGEYKNRIKLQK